MATPGVSINEIYKLLLPTPIMGNDLEALCHYKPMYRIVDTEIKKRLKRLED